MTNNNEKKPHNLEDGFIKFLIDRYRADDTAAMACLRRSLQGEASSQIAAYRYIAPFLQSDNGRNDENMFLLVGGLFALYPTDQYEKQSAEEIGDLGWSCRKLSSEDDNPSSANVLRFRALLDAEQADIDHHLRSLIALLGSSKHKIPVNYIQLLCDLRRWQHPDKYVQRRWARNYWQQTWKTTKESETADLIELVQHELT